jgi:DNA-binding CsgD family transcriptional regulator
MAFGNGLVLALMFGCMVNMAGKYRVFWTAVALSMGLFVYHLVLGPVRELLPYTFAVAGIALTASGVLLLVFLAGIKKPAIENRAVAENREFPQNEASGIPDTEAKAGRGGLLSCIFPILAALIIFWRNSFTDKLFLTTLNINFPPGFNLTSVIPIAALSVFGFLASLRWRRFLKEYIRLGAFLFLLSPSLLLLSHSQTLFLILHILNVTVIRMMIVIFPFAIIDLYWQNPRRHGYWSYLLAVSIYMFNANALSLTGPFKSISLEDGYAVVLLSLAAVAFYFLSQPLILPKPSNTAGTTVPAAAAPVVAAPPTVAMPNIADIFREHNLSEREMDVALLMVQEGLDNKEMGKRLFISENTIKFHIYNIYQKFGVKKRAELLAKVLNK